MDERAAAGVYDPEELYKQQRAAFLRMAETWLRAYGRARVDDCARDGFLPNKPDLYDFEAFGRGAYLSDFQRAMTRLINGRHAFVLNDKLAFSRTWSAFPVARLVGFYERGWTLLEEATGDLYLKPTLGGRGAGVRRIQADEIPDALESPHVLTAAVVQHPLLASFYPGAVNTVRVLVMRDTAAFIATAVLRVGTARSGGVDNFSKGGISFSVDLATGELGLGAQKALRPSLTRHPDTGARIAGETLPYWQETVDLVLAAADHHPALRYVGWDVVISPEGPILLEGNSFTDVPLLQVHRPLLADERVRAFYEAEGTLAYRVA